MQSVLFAVMNGYLVIIKEWKPPKKRTFGQQATSVLVISSLYLFSSPTYAKDLNKA